MKSNKKIHNHTERTVKKTQPTFLKALMISVPVGMAVCAVLVVVLSFILVKLENPEMFVFPAGAVCVALSAFLSAFVATKIRKTSFVLTSICVFLALFVILFVLSFTGLRKGQTDLMVCSVITLSMLVASLIGGRVASMQTSPRKKYARR